MFGNKNTTSSMFTRELVHKPVIPIPVIAENIIEKNQIRNDMKAQEFKKERDKIPGMDLLKKIHKEKQKQKVVLHDDSSDDDDDIERYTNSIKKVIKLFS